MTQQRITALLFKENQLKESRLLMFLILIFCSLYPSRVSGFGAPGIIPPESFIAERWYPSNLPTVMPPWKQAGIDISHFRTARPHQSPGANLVTTTAVAPTNSLPMPPGSTSPAFVTPEITRNEPHPPASPPSSVEASGGLPSSVEQQEEEENSGRNSTIHSNTDELVTIGVTEANKQNEILEQGVLKVLSPVFEDITKADNISSSEEILKVNSAEGSGDNEPELISTSETTTTSTIDKSEKTTSASFTTMTTIETETSESSIATTAAEMRVTESFTTNSTISSTLSPTTSFAITTPSSSPSVKSATNDIQDAKAITTIKTKLIDGNTTKRLPTKECKDIIFLLDSSGNVVQQYEKQKLYIEEIVRKLEAENPRRMALITFAGRTRQKIIVPLPEIPNGSQFLEKLKKARFLKGVTASGAAISVTTQYVLQKSRPVQVVMITDGFSFDDVERQSEGLRAVVGMDVFVTGRYFPVVRNVLLSIGGADDHVFFDKKEQQLLDALQC